MATATEQATKHDVKSGTTWLLWVVVALTAVMAVLWSSHKVLNQDEIFSLQTDRVSSLGEVLRIQQYYPISLEAPPYHVLAHEAIGVLGPTAFALRLPSFLGYLLMQVCLFYFVKNLAGERAGLVAVAISGLTATLYYAAEGRPYGVLLGSYAMTALCWQVAAKRGERGESRVWPMAGLIFALSLTLNVHFYGVLLLVPLCAAELVRSVVRKKIDQGMVAAIVVSMGTIVGSLPYVKASSEFKKHYYAALISPHMMTQPYRQMLLDYTRYPHAVQTVLACLLVVAAALVVWGCVRAVRVGQAELTMAEGALLLLLVMLPMFAFVLGRLVTHALESRHSFGAIVGIVSLIAIALSVPVRKTVVFYAVMAVLVVGIVAVNAARAREAEADSRLLLDALVLTPEIKAVVGAQRVYFQDVGQWEFASQYEPDPELRSRLVLVYSLDEEMRRRNHDTNYLTAIHQKRFTNQPIVAYEELRRTPGEYVFATFHSGWSWTDAAFKEEAAEVTPLGRGFGGDVVKVRFK